MINTKTETMAVSVVKRNRRKATTAPVIPVVTTDIISIPKGESEMKTDENDLADPQPSVTNIGQLDHTVTPIMLPSIVPPLVIDLTDDSTDEDNEEKDAITPGFAAFITPVHFMAPFVPPIIGTS